MTPGQFYAKYLGVWTQESPQLGPQCVWAFKLFCKENSIPVVPTPNGWADGYWYSKDELGFGKYFEYITDYKQFREGDWVIWPRKAGNSHPSSHIALYLYKTTGNTAMEFSLNQGGDGRFCAKGTVFYDALGALRWKGYTNMDIQKGFHQTVFGGVTVSTIRATAASGYELHLISAGTVQDFMSFDSDKLAIVGAINCNYFVSDKNSPSYGMHLGCEWDAWLGERWEAPKAPGIVAYYIDNDGKIGAHDQSTFYLSAKDVGLLFAPYSVRIHGGEEVNIISTSFTSKEDSYTEQSAVMKIGDDWCLANFSACRPADIAEFAKQAGASECAILDGGGSAQMFECSTTGTRKAVRYTERPVTTVLVLAKRIESDDLFPENPDPTLLPNDEQDSTPGAVEEPDKEPEKNNAAILPNNVYDVLKLLCTVVLPAVIVLLSSLFDIWSTPNGDKIISTLAAINVFVGALIGVSSKQYWKEVNGNDR